MINDDISTMRTSDFKRDTLNFTSENLSKQQLPRSVAPSERSLVSANSRKGDLTGLSRLLYMMDLKSLPDSHIHQLFPNSMRS